MDRIFYSNYDNKNLLYVINKLPRPLVFTNGVFDILHIGHIKYLQESKRFGSSLVVGVNSDKSVKLLNKGPERPINPEKERAEIIASLKVVDLCVIFNECNPLDLIKLVIPDVYTKGKDYNLKTIQYSQQLREMKIKINFIPLIDGISSTKIVSKLKNELI